MAASSDINITPEIGAFLQSVNLCYVATVNADGSPNLSPKASLSVWDAATLVFADMASPGTVANLHGNPAIEINVVDIFKRRGYRFRGRAIICNAGSPEFDKVAGEVRDAHGPAYPVNHVVRIDVHEMREVRSPAYMFGDGVTEAALETVYRERYRGA